MYCHVSPMTDSTYNLIHMHPPFLMMKLLIFISTSAVFESTTYSISILISLHFWIVCRPFFGFKVFFIQYMYRSRLVLNVLNPDIFPVSEIWMPYISCTWSSDSWLYLKYVERRQDPCHSLPFKRGIVESDGRQRQEQCGVPALSLVLAKFRLVITEGDVAQNYQVLVQLT